MSTSTDGRDDQANDLERLADEWFGLNPTIHEWDAILRSHFADHSQSTAGPAGFEQFRNRCQAALNHRLDRAAVGTGPADQTASDRCVSCGATAGVSSRPVEGPAPHAGQKLCDLCSACAGDIDFRATESPLTAAAAELPDVAVAPLSGGDGDAALREQALCRWINRLYRCAAVDELLATGDRGRLSGVKLRIRPGNDRSWLAPHLKWTIGRINNVEPAGEDQSGEGQIPPTEEPAVPAVDPVNIPAGKTKPDASADHSPTEPAGLITLKETLERIAEVERFFIRVQHRDGRRVRGNLSRGIKPYPFENALNGEKTVDFWKTTRFLQHYPRFDGDDYVVQVFGGDGSPCAGQTKVRNVRESYAD